MRFPGLALAALGMALAAAPAIAQQDDAHHAHAHGHEAVSPASDATPAMRYPTDAPLRAGMRGIADTVDALAAARAAGDLDHAAAAAHAGRIRAGIATIVAECALPADADAALHPILAALAEGAGALERDPADPAAIPALQAALADYARRFDAGTR